MNNSGEYNHLSTEDMEWKAPTEQEDEQSEKFDIPFYVTDHSARHEHTGSPEQLEALYSDIKQDGVASVRYDWDWNNIQPEDGSFDTPHLERYQQAKETMDKVGLEAPTIVLSNIPKWANELYKTDKEAFFIVYNTYVDEVAARLAEAGGKKVECVQILNEFNNKIYNPIATEDLPRMCDIARQAFQSYNPDIKLMGTVIAGNVNDLAAKAGQGTGIKEYLPELKKIKDSLDVIAIDYYPGLWHQPDIKKIFSSAHKDVYKDIGLLKEVFAEVATWGKEYELGEVGLPTNKLFGDEKNQRYFYDTFFRSLKHLMVEFRGNHTKLPSRIGLYEAIDEPPQDWKGKLLNPVHPEFNLGMRRGDSERKMILQGKKHDRKGSSQLKNIIRYFQASMKPNKSK